MNGKVVGTILMVYFFFLLGICVFSPLTGYQNIENMFSCLEKYNFIFGDPEAVGYYFEALCEIIVQGF